jgi:hypothetical protein
MRPNVVFVVLVLMLAGFAVGLFARDRPAHVPAAPPPPSVASSTSAPASTPSATSAPSAPSAAPNASTSAAPAASAAPPLDRPLRVVTHGWELLAPGVVANDGGTAGKQSVFAKHGLAVELSAVDDAGKVEAALARGGADEHGADVAVLALPTFVASYERLRALAPVIFFVTGWSEGREVLFSKTDTFATLPKKGALRLRGRSGEAAAFLGLFGLELAGIAPERVELVDDVGASWSATTRPRGGDPLGGKILLSTGEASRLVALVAVAPAALVDKSTAALEIWAQGWLEGQARVAADAAGAGRRVASLKGAPEALGVLSRLGELSAASLADNAAALGLSGRGAVTVQILFDRCWSLWRAAKVLSIPPEHAPVDGRIVAALVRSGEGARPTEAAARPASDGSEPLLVHQLPKGELDEERLVERLGFLAGVFRRSPLRLTLHGPRAAHAQAVLDRTAERFALGGARLALGKARGAPGSPATIEILPVP